MHGIDPSILNFSQKSECLIKDSRIETGLRKENENWSRVHNVTEFMILLKGPFNYLTKFQG